MHERPCRGRALRLSTRLDAVALERLDNTLGIEIVHAHAQVVDACRSWRCVGAAATTAPGEHDELAAPADAIERRAWSLIGLYAQPQEIGIKQVRARAVAYEDRAVAPPFQRQQSFSRRRLHRSAQVAEQSCSPAVSPILQLHHDAVGIAEVQLSSAVARTPGFGSANAHAHLHRAA